MSGQIVTPAPVYRHPLGLPAGSVRTTLALLIVASFVFLLALPEEKPAVVPMYLYFLLALLLPFFAAHGSSIAGEGGGQPSPWWMPRGTFRWLFALALIGVVAWQYYVNPELLMRRLTPPMNQLSLWPRLLLALAGGFLVGWIIRLGPWRRAYWYQDLVAWVSLLAMIGLAGVIFVEVFVNPNIEQRHELPLVETILVAIVAFYFGVRCR